MVKLADTAPIARLSGITKRFGRVAVVQDVSLNIFGGEVHVLAGENGAGKSTLISILGAFTPISRARSRSMVARYGHDRRSKRRNSASR